MSEKTVEMLDQEIQGCLESMNDLEAVNMPEYGEAVTNVTKLMDKLVELKKLDIEQSKLEQMKEIEKSKLEQMKEIETEKIDSENKDRLVKNVITVVTTGAGFVLMIWGTKKTFQFEETGSITSTAGRKYLDALLSKFKK